MFKIKRHGVYDFFFFNTMTDETYSSVVIEIMTCTLNVVEFPDCFPDCFSVYIQKKILMIYILLFFYDSFYSVSVKNLSKHQLKKNIILEDTNKKIF